MGRALADAENVTPDAVALSDPEPHEEIVAVKSGDVLGDVDSVADTLGEPDKDADIDVLAVGDAVRFPEGVLTTVALAVHAALADALRGVVRDTRGETVGERVTRSSLRLGDALVDGEGLSLTTEAVGEKEPLEGVACADRVALLLASGLGVADTDVDALRLGEPRALDDAIDETECDAQAVEERDGIADRDVVWHADDVGLWDAVRYIEPDTVCVRVRSDLLDVGDELSTTDVVTAPDVESETSAEREAEPETDCDPDNDVDALPLREDDAQAETVVRGDADSSDAVALAVTGAVGLTVVVSEKSATVADCVSLGVAVADAEIVARVADGESVGRLVLEETALDDEERVPDRVTDRDWVCVSETEKVARATVAETDGDDDSVFTTVDDRVSVTVAGFVRCGDDDGESVVDTVAELESDMYMERVDVLEAVTESASVGFAVDDAVAVALFVGLGVHVPRGLRDGERETLLLADMLDDAVSESDTRGERETTADPLAEPEIRADIELDGDADAEREPRADLVVDADADGERENAALDDGVTLTGADCVSLTRADSVKLIWGDCVLVSGAESVTEIGGVCVSVTGAESVTEIAAVLVPVIGADRVTVSRADFETDGDAVSDTESRADADAVLSALTLAGADCEGASVGRADTLMVPVSGAERVCESSADGVFVLVVELESVADDVVLDDADPVFDELDDADIVDEPRLVALIRDADMERLGSGESESDGLPDDDGDARADPLVATVSVGLRDEDGDIVIERETSGDLLTLAHALGVRDTGAEKDVDGGMVDVAVRAGDDETEGLAELVFESRRLTVKDGVADGEPLICGDLVPLLVTETELVGWGDAVSDGDGVELSDAFVAVALGEALPTALGVSERSGDRLADGDRDPLALPDGDCDADVDCDASVKLGGAVERGDADGARDTDVLDDVERDRDGLAEVDTDSVALRLMLGVRDARADAVRDEEPVADTLASDEKDSEADTLMVDDGESGRRVLVAHSDATAERDADGDAVSDAVALTEREDDAEAVTVDVGLVETVLVTDVLTESDADTERESTAEADDVGDADSHTVAVDDTLPDRLGVAVALAL